MEDKAEMSARRAEVLEVVSDDAMFLNPSYLDDAIIGTAVVYDRTVPAYSLQKLWQIYYDHADSSLYANDDERVDLASQMVDDAQRSITYFGSKAVIVCELEV